MIPLLLTLLLLPKPSLEIRGGSADGAVSCLKGNGFMHCPGPVFPIIYVVLKDPSPELYCPKITVEISGGAYVDSHESDCEPWEEWKLVNPLDRITWGKIIRGRLGEGRWTIRVRLEQGKKSLTKTFEVQVGATSGGW